MRKGNSVLNVGVCRHTISQIISSCNNVRWNAYPEGLCHIAISNYSLQPDYLNGKFAELVKTGYKVNIE